MIADDNLAAANSIASIIKSNGGGPWTLLAADAVKMGIGIVPSKRAGGSQQEVDSASTEIGTITVRTTKNQTRLGGEAGEPGIKITYKDGTEFDMTQTRVKETEANPYVSGGVRPVRFEDGLDNKGTKRAPTQDELNWFNSIKWD